MQAKPVAPLSTSLPLVRRRSADTTTLVAPYPHDHEREVDPFLATRCARLLRLPLTVPHRRPQGPLSRFLYDGERQYCIDGVIGAGTFGRVALATVLDTSPPARVAIKVFSKAGLYAGPALPEMYEVERRIMLENAREDAKWLVQLRGSFADPWNCYLVMVRHPERLVYTSRVCARAHLVSLRRIITQTRLRASFLAVETGFRISPVFGSKNLYVFRSHTSCLWYNAHVGLFTNRLWPCTSSSNGASSIAI